MILLIGIGSKGPALGEPVGFASDTALLESTGLFEGKCFVWAGVVGKNGGLQQKNGLDIPKKNCYINTYIALF